MTKRSAGFADLGMIAILAALCVIIVAGVIMWRRAENANRANEQRVHNVVKESPSYKE